MPRLRGAVLPGQALAHQALHPVHQLRHAARQRHPPGQTGNRPFQCGAVFAGPGQRGVALDHGGPQAHGLGFQVRNALGLCAEQAAATRLRLSVGGQQGRMFALQGIGRLER